MQIRKQALLAKLETTYGVDSTPTGAANAMLVRNLVPTPIATAREARDLYRPFLANSSDVIGAVYGQLKFDVEVTGAGSAGGIPGYDPLLRACGLARVNSPGVSTTYTPANVPQESVVLYFYLDGVLHKLLGARGNVGYVAENRQAVMFRFDFMGLFQPVVDASLPAAVYSTFGIPLAMNKANTPVFNIHSVSAPVLRRLSFDLGNQVSYRNLVNGEAVRINDRKPSGSLEIEANVMATMNWFNMVRDATTGTMQLVHGTQTGNIVELGAPSLQINDVTYSDFEGDAMLQMATKYMPVVGNDEVSIIVR